MTERALVLASRSHDVEAVGYCWMGLGSAADDAVLHLMRRLPLDKPVRNADSDDDVLRALASAANETVDALALPAARQAMAIERVAKRYARVLDVNARDLTAALNASAKTTTPAAEQPA